MSTFPISVEILPDNAVSSSKQLDAYPFSLTDNSLPSLKNGNFSDGNSAVIVMTDVAYGASTITQKQLSHEFPDHTFHYVHYEEPRSNLIDNYNQMNDTIRMILLNISSHKLAEEINEYVPRGRRIILVGLGSGSHTATYTALCLRGEFERECVTIVQSGEFVKDTIHTSDLRINKLIDSNDIQAWEDAYNLTSDELAMRYARPWFRYESYGDTIAKLRDVIE